MLRVLISRLLSLFEKTKDDEELDEEIRAHLDMTTEDNIRHGMSPVEARRAARRSFGGVEQMKEVRREIRGIRWLEETWRDVCHAARGLVASPGFTAVALVSLALGIGVNTAIFTMVHGILIERLPVAEPERIVQFTGSRGASDLRRFTYSVYEQVRWQTEVFDVVAGFASQRGVLETGGESLTVHLYLVTGEYFRLLDGSPALGRLLSEEDDRVEGADPVCVLSYSTWQTHFGGDPEIVGRALLIDGVPARVVGVAGAGFADAEMQRSVDLWMPTASKISLSPFARDYRNWIEILGRLRLGLTIESASARLEAARAAIESGLPERRRNRGARYRVVDASRGIDTWAAQLHDPLWILMGAVGFVLLIACANLANLLLARVSHRTQEFAVKLALGISRWRLMRQLLIESLMVAGAGGLAALAVSGAVTRGLLAVFNQGQRMETLQVRADATVLWFALACAAVTAVVAGLYPAWQATRTVPGPRLQAGARSGTRGNFVRRGLVVAQVTLTVALVYAAGLLSHSLRNLRAIDLGYEVDQVLTAELAPREIYHEAREQNMTGGRLRVSPVNRKVQLAALLERVQALPAVESADYSMPGLLTGPGSELCSSVAEADGTNRRLSDVTIVAAGPDFFSTYGIPVVQGRGFRTSDREGAPLVAVVNRRLGREIGDDPIGRQVRLCNGYPPEVVGVAADSKYYQVREEIQPTVYVAFDQDFPMFGGDALQVRFRGGLGSVESEVRELVRDVAPQYQVSSMNALEMLRDAQLQRERMLAHLSMLIGALGISLALVGIYGLVSYAVARRTREVGIRMSLGAQRADVLRLFVSEAFLLIAAGIAIGTPIAIALARGVESLLYEVSPTEPADLGVAVSLLAAAGLIAASIPAWRATRVNPVEAIRHE